MPPRRSTRRRSLIGLEVSEKKAHDREKAVKKIDKKVGKVNKLRQKSTRVKKKQRLAAEIVDERETEDFIILNPSM